MSHVLLLRLAGPLQSWGTQSRFSHRDTATEPTKSGVLGFLGAAFGLKRDDRAGLAGLASLRLGIRVDREGHLMTDYHTTGGGRLPGRNYGVATSRGDLGGPVLSERDYLADADFLVGLESDDNTMLMELDAALLAPVWPLFLGRRCFPPSIPPRIGVYADSLESILKRWPWRSRYDAPRPPSVGLRLIIETNNPCDEVRYDVPTSFEIHSRCYHLRRIHTSFLSAADVRVEEPDICPILRA